MKLRNFLKDQCPRRDFLIISISKNSDNFFTKPDLSGIIIRNFYKNNKP